MAEIMGILNMTPNSFSDGGLYIDPVAALDHADRLFSDGATLVDVGAEATNPYAKPLSQAEEWHRLQYALPDLMGNYSGKLSLDTLHSETANRALKLGDIIINNVMAFHDPSLLYVVGRNKPTCIISHVPSGAQSISEVHRNYEMNDALEVKDQLLLQVQIMVAQGVPRENIILDPGIGFGKSMRLNWELLEFAKLVPDFRVLIGHSKKRFLAHDSQTGKALYKNKAENSELRNDVQRNQYAANIALRAGAWGIRVHEPKDYVELAKAA